MAVAPRIALEGTDNLRPVRARGIRPGALFRSDALDAVDDAGWSAVAVLGVRTVVDLRGADERAPAAGAAEIPVVVEPVFASGAADYVADATPLVDFSLELLTRHAEGVAAAVRAVAVAADGGVLVHCSAGKDRTGVVVALALAVAGARREDIVADYAASEVHLRERWLSARLEWLAGFHPREVLERSLELIGGSPSHVMEAVLNRVEAEWGSAAGYLEAHGLTADELDRLRARLR